MKKPILAVPASVVDFVGFVPANDAVLSKIFSNAVVVDRPEAEQDEGYKQIIPYCVIFNNKGEILVYKRGEAGNEGRLHNLYSIGVGGHVDSLSCENAREKTNEACVREIREEIREDPKGVKIVGVLYDDSNHVGRVHLGIVYFARVSSANDFEDTIKEAGFDTLANINDLNLESWSRIVVESGVIKAKKAGHRG